MPARALARVADVNVATLDDMRRLLRNADEHKMSYDRDGKFASLVELLQAAGSDQAVWSAVLTTCRLVVRGGGVAATGGGGTTTTTTTFEAALSEFLVAVRVLGERLTETKTDAADGDVAMTDAAAAGQKTSSEWAPEATAYEAVRKALIRLGRRINERIPAHTNRVRYVPLHEAAGLLPYTSDGRVLVGRFADGLCPLGGKAEADETPWETAVREFREESSDEFTPVAGSTGTRTLADDWKTLDGGVKTSQTFYPGAYVLFLLPWTGSKRSAERTVAAASRGTMPRSVEWIDLRNSPPSDWRSWGRELVFNAGVRSHVLRT